MRMTEDDASARRDHARRSGSATEYDALHGPGLYGRKPSEALRNLAQHALERIKTGLQPAKKRATPKDL